MVSSFSTISSIIIPHGQSLLINDSSRIILVVGSEVIEFQNREKSISCNSLAIRGQIKMINTSEKQVSVRAVIFSNELNYLIEPNTPLSFQDLGQQLLAAKIIDFCFSQTPPFNNQQIEQQLAELINNECINHLVKTQLNKNNKIDPRLIKINRYIRKYFEQPITLNTLAELIGCNPVYLSNTYKKVLGISPMQHLQKIRMDRAKELLLNENYSIGDITIKVGYLTISQFGVIFKKHFGQSPQEYRNHHLFNINQKMFTK